MDAPTLAPSRPATAAGQAPFTLRQEAGYHALPDDFYTRMPAEKVTDDPVLIHASPAAAALIGLEASVLAHPDFPRIFAGLEPLPGYEPLALVYSGHQFGAWAGQLGDGRALTIGQVRGPDGALRDIQLKGAGKTPYSRFADGRAVLRSSIREYLCSEAMAALGVPTTRALAVVATMQPVRRETIEPGAVATRLLPSNIRFGHFEHFGHGGRPDLVRLLADFVIAEHDPDLAGAPDAHARWFARVVERTAVMIAHWQAVGFAHGVMNTDNMSILGVTLDYGPFGFLDAFDPGFICNHTDELGRYAFDRQPGIGLWNLQALAAALGSLLPQEALREALKLYVPAFVTRYTGLMRDKLALVEEREGDDDLVTGLLGLMKASRADYTLSFRRLSATDGLDGRIAWLSLFEPPQQPAAKAWLERWQARVADERPFAGTARLLDAANPKYVLRNWLAETAIRAVEDKGDLDTLDRIFRLVTEPFAEHPEHEAFAAPPPEAMAHLEVSCSS